jgi:nitroreductase
MVDVIECILGRRNVRKFLKKPVNERLVDQILELATHAPSAGDVQEWRFILVRDAEQRKKLAIAALRQEFVAEAPLVIVICADMERVDLRYGERGRELYAIQDTAYASLLIALTAHAMGLASCLVRAFDEEHVREILNLPAGLRPVVIMPIGYPAERPEEFPRIPHANVTWVDRHGQRYGAVVRKILA